MTDTFIKKIREKSEAKKLGRKVEDVTYDKNGKQIITERVLGQRKNPRMTMRYMVPIGRKRAIAKPE